MAPPKQVKKGGKPKKEKVFHPLSRKADQLVRTQIRKSKLAEQAKARSKKHDAQGVHGMVFMITESDTTSDQSIYTVSSIMRSLLRVP